MGYTSGDTLDGGTGNDILFGGRGADAFIYDTDNGGADTVLDFTIGTDTLDLGANAAFDSFAEIIAAGSQLGLDTVFDFGGGNTLTLSNTVLDDLTGAEFGFGSGSAAEKPPETPVAEVWEEAPAADTAELGILTAAKNPAGSPMR